MGGRPLSIEGVDVEDALERIEDLELLEELLGEFATTWADGAKIGGVRLNGVARGPVRLELVEPGLEAPLRTVSKILPRHIPS